MTAALASVRIREVLQIARQLDASDVHLCAGVPPVFRINGGLQLQDTLVPDVAEIEAVAASLLEAVAVKRFEHCHDVTITRTLEDIGTIRVHVYRTSAGTSIALRLLAQHVPALESLRLPHVLRTLVEKAHGLIIVAGPTGSGKSTTLAALVDRINRAQARHIVTIEDPIEYRHEPDRSLIHQREVGSDVPTFAKGVHGALRSDPDVILVGEMRDAKTMQAALTAAETGHLVLTTLHTGDASQTVDRIVGVFAGEKQEHIRMQLSQTLLAAACIRLVPRADGRGRQAALELLIGTEAVRNVIRDGKTHQLRNIISTSRVCGMQTLESHLCELVARGDVTLDAARAASSRPDELRPAEPLLI